jgi:hypothetical protein
VSAITERNVSDLATLKLIREGISRDIGRARQHPLDMPALIQFTGAMAKRVDLLADILAKHIRESVDS